MKKIFFYMKHMNIGGAERVLLEILENIDSSKYDITLILRTKIEEENILIKNIPSKIKITSILPDEIAKKNLKYKNIKKNFIQKIYFRYIKFLLKKAENIFYKKIRDEKYDIGINFYSNYSDIKNIKAKKYITWIHNSIKEKEKYRKNELSYEEKISSIGERLEGYDKIVAICDDMVEEIKGLYPRLESKIIRIYNPFNFQRIREGGEDFSELSLEKIDFIKKEEYAVSVMRITKDSKDFETLFKGFKLYLEKSSSNLKLVVVGDGPDREYVENLIKGMKLEKNVKLFGSLKNPYPVVKNSKIFIHSSKSEGFGLVLVEAQILGKAIVSSDCPIGPREILKDGEVGILYSVGDFEQLALEIEKLNENVELKRYYEAEGKEAAKRFDKRIILQEVEEKCFI